MGDTYSESRLVTQALEIVAEVQFSRVKIESSGMSPDEVEKRLLAAMDAQSEEARKIARSKRFKKVFCAAASATTSNLKEITKLTVASLVSLHAASVISIALTPIFVAAVVVVVMDAGVSGFCYSEKEGV